MTSSGYHGYIDWITFFFTTRPDLVTYGWLTCESGALVSTGELTMGTFTCLSTIMGFQICSLAICVLKHFVLRGFRNFRFDKIGWSMYGSPIPPIYSTIIGLEHVRPIIV